MICGVPQDSVIEPVLWDLGYNAVFRTALSPGAAVVGYADDTIVGSTWDEALAASELTVACVVAAIGSVGSKMVPSKTEVLSFLRKRTGASPPSA